MAEYTRDIPHQKIKGGEKHICPEFFHYRVCMGRANRPCFGCDCFVPAADVRENVRGRWIDRTDSTTKSYVFFCSVCNEIAYYVPHGKRKGYVRHCGYAFCPNCGADMRGGDDG